jgi:tripartite-type tricarboxylate transporter receptor subunit TctC
LPPGIAADRLKLLRESFVQLMNDPAFRADVKKRGLEVEPTNGDELEKLAKQVINQPPEVIERVKQLMGK